MIDENVLQDEWQKLNETFAEAAALSEAEREDYLKKIAAASLRRKVRRMLAAAKKIESSDFLDQNVFSIGAKMIGADNVPEKIGKYKIIKEIGRGGMGAVFLAGREDFKQTVALKIIKRGMDTDEIVRRFRRERQVLASLDHPFIARLLDGGTTEKDLPYFVMEYVEGLSVTEYCDRNKLSVEERLALFRKICSAVAYAHQNLIVHRDLKPSNILVTKTGEPKLLDFGISKLLASNLTDSTVEQTAAEMRLMTPEYASPEQIRGEQITTASDVYSLGVLLYELLSGHRPLKLKNRPTGEILKIISEREPSAPSTAALTAGEIIKGETKEIVSPETIAEARSEKPERLKRKLAGDLDNIVLKSLSKEPARRYGSVEQFSEDVRRHLEGLPVAARQATFFYGANKFIKRNKMAAAFAGFALLALCLGFSVAVWQAVEARNERARAERRFDEVRKLASTLISDWHKDIPESLVSNRVRGRIADISTEYLDNLALETDDPALLKELAKAYITVGKEYTFQLIYEEKARSSLQKAEAILRGLITKFPADAETKRLLAECLGQYDGYFGERNLDESLKIRAEIAQIHEEILAAAPEDLPAMFDLANAYALYGKVLKFTGRKQEANDFYRRATEIRKKRVEILEANAASTEDLLKLANTYVYLAGDRTGELGDHENAAQNLRRATEIAERLYAENPENQNAVFAAGTAYFELGKTLKKTGDFKNALPALEKSLVYTRIYLARSRTGYFIRKEYDALLEIAEARNETGETGAALAALRESINQRRLFTEANEDNFRTYFGHGFHFNSVGKLLARMNRKDEARAAYLEAEQAYQKVLQNEPNYLTNRRYLSVVYLQTADLFAGNGVCNLKNSYDFGGLGESRYCPPQTTNAKPLDIEKARFYYRKAFDILREFETQKTAHFEDLENLRLDSGKQVSKK